MSLIVLVTKIERSVLFSKVQFSVTCIHTKAGTLAHFTVAMKPSTFHFSGFQRRPNKPSFSVLLMGNFKCGVQFSDLSLRNRLINENALCRISNSQRFG